MSLDALEGLKEMRMTFNREQKPLEEADLLLAEANIARELGDADTGLTNAMRCQVICSDEGYQAGEAEALWVVALCQIAKGTHKAALRSFERARLAFQNLEEKAKEASCCHMYTETCLVHIVNDGHKVGDRLEDMS